MNDLPAFHQPETWNDASADYERLAEPFTSMFAIALADRLAIQVGDKVLDIACGPGALSLHLAKRGAAVTAVDHSPGMITRLLARAQAENIALHAEAMDGQALALADDSFDGALSAFGIFLFPDNAAGLAEAVRVVRPSGRIGLATWEGAFGAGPSLLFHRAYNAMFPDHAIALPCAGAVAWGDPDVLRGAMAAAGLVDVDVTAHTAQWTFPTAAWVGDHADRLFKIFPAWTTLADDERERVIHAIVASLADAAPTSVPTTALLAIGTKPGQA